MLKAALFDMDGLLFDTEAMYARLANEAARPLGFAFTEQMILDTLGVNETDCNAYYGSRIPAYRAETFWPAYHAAANRYVAEHGAPQKPYLLETLQRLSRPRICRPRGPDSDKSARRLPRPASAQPIPPNGQGEKQSCRRRRGYSSLWRDRRAVPAGSAAPPAWVYANAACAYLPIFDMMWYTKRSNEEG